MTTIDRNLFEMVTDAVHHGKLTTVAELRKAGYERIETNLRICLCLSDEPFKLTSFGGEEITSMLAEPVSGGNISFANTDDPHRCVFNRYCTVYFKGNRETGTEEPVSRVMIVHSNGCIERLETVELVYEWCVHTVYREKNHLIFIV
jgi:hypothetical protein